MQDICTLANYGAVLPPRATLFHSSHLPLPTSLQSTSLTPSPGAPSVHESSLLASRSIQFAAMGVVKLRQHHASTRRSFNPHKALITRQVPHRPYRRHQGQSCVLLPPLPFYLLPGFSSHSHRAKNQRRTPKLILNGRKFFSCPLIS